VELWAATVPVDDLALDFLGIFCANVIMATLAACDTKAHTQYSSVSSKLDNT
jgi:hypothetical protein